MQSEKPVEESLQSNIGEAQPIGTETAVKSNIVTLPKKSSVVYPQVRSWAANHKHKKNKLKKQHKKRSAQRTMQKKSRKGNR